MAKLVAPGSVEPPDSDCSDGPARMGRAAGLGLLGQSGSDCVGRLILAGRLAGPSPAPGPG